MTTTSGYSGKLGGRSSPDQIQSARLLGYREARKRTARVAAVVVAADGPNETANDDERQMVYDVRLEELMG